MTRPVRRDVVLDGKRLETVLFDGDRQRPAIVLLHEGLGSVAMWRDVPQLLAGQTGSVVLAYSRHGYGRSSPLDAQRDVDYMHHEGSVVLPALLDALAIERPILFGHSDGASIALIYAGEHHDAAHALVLEAPHVFVEDLTVASIAGAKSAYASTNLRERLGRYHEDVDGAFRGWNDIWLDPRFRAWNIEAYAERVRCPVLVVQGDADEYGTLAQVESIATRIPGTQTFIIPGAGHSPHRDAAEAVLSRVATFVDDVAVQLRRS